MTDYFSTLSMTSLSPSDLAEKVSNFLTRYAKTRPDFDPAWDEEEEKWTGPDSYMMDTAADHLMRGEKPPHVHSDWKSGTYREMSNKEAQAEHDALVAEINRRAK